jgi:hypothetical protein
VRRIASARIEQRDGLCELTARSANQAEVVERLRGLDMRASEKSLLVAQDAPGEADGGGRGPLTVSHQRFD